jgi:hypothetical protein
MLKLGPRKRIDPAKIPTTSKPEKACCAFCKARIDRPRPMGLVLGGTCKGCGALFIDDSNGKLGGEALVEGLTLLAGGSVEGGMELREGRDFECKALVYDERRHEVQLEADPRRYGVGRMWYFRRLPV